MKSQKRVLGWQELVLEPECWRGKGLPPLVEEIMTNGAPVDMAADIGSYEIPQYPFASDEARPDSNKYSGFHARLNVFMYGPRNPDNLNAFRIHFQPLYSNIS